MSVGGALAQAREEQGMSVEDVSAATRIRAGLIRCIEADNFDPCGGAVYARGHIRSIGRVVGIDPEPLISEFDAEHAIDVSPPVAVPVQPTDPDIVARADRKRPNWTGAMVAALVVICVLAGVGLVRSNGTGSHSATGGPSPAPVTTSSRPSPSPASPPASAVAQLPSDLAMALVRVTSDRSWLSVETFGGRVLFQGLMSAGESRAFRDSKGLRLVIGNAPVVQLVADGREIGAPRSSGNVAHVTVQPGGNVQFA